MSAVPADRATAERAIGGIYARLGRARPGFVWVDSPAAALPLVTGWPTLDTMMRWAGHRSPPGRPPVATDLAVAVARLRSTLGATLPAGDPEASVPKRRKPDPPGKPAHRKGTKELEPWPDLAPHDAVRFGVPIGLVLHRGIRQALFRSLMTGLAARVRAGLGQQSGLRTGRAGGSGPAMPVCWYGQQDASWIAYYDVLGRLGLARYPASAAAELAEWAALARSGGWWWPGEDVCVLVERPSQVRTRPVRGALFDEVEATAVGFPDGWWPALTT